MKIFAHYLFVFCLILAGCSTTEKGTEEEEEDESSPFFDFPDEAADEFFDEDLTETDLLLLRTRSWLSDHYTETGQTIPDIYQKEINLDEQKSDPFSGFRVQLLSTRNVDEADSVRDHFVAWSDTTIAGYEPDAYVIFKSPTYRVRAGDFQDRNKAIEFSRLIKNRYPDAWVVHERIEPSKVPADTADIRFGKLSPLKQD